MALDSELMALVRAIVLRHASEAVRLLAESPALARARLEVGASREAGRNIPAVNPLFRGG